MQIESTILWDFARQNYGDKPHGNNRYNGVTPAMVIWNLLQRYTREVIANKTNKKFIMKDNHTNKLMNTLMYDALINAGVKEEDARAAAIEAGRNDLRYIAFEYAIKELRTEMHSELRRLQTQMIGLMLSCSALIIGFSALIN